MKNSNIQSAVLTDFPQCPHHFFLVFGSGNVYRLDEKPHANDFGAVIVEFNVESERTRISQPIL